MKVIIASLLSILINVCLTAQCSTVAVQISSSDTSYVQLYNAGIFNIPSGNENICIWEVTDFSGTIIHQDTTSGDFGDQSFSIFDHTVPITDSMKATIVITNEVEGIICTMNDTLYWKETEVLPGSFIGNWDVLSSNGGMEEMITSSTFTAEVSQSIYIFPCPAYDYFQLKGNQSIYKLTILDLQGNTIKSVNQIHSEEKIDISSYPTGIYIVRFWDEKNRKESVSKFIKM